MSKNILIPYPPPYPKTAHLYITSACKLNCSKCHYRSRSDSLSQLSFKKIKQLFIEWSKAGLRSIAIGGGEPLLHPDIVNIIDLGRKMGFYMAITSNGTILKPINPNRIHISYDEIHPTWKNVELIQKAIYFYSRRKCTVGINHIMTSLKNLEYIESFDRVNTILLIREKPASNFCQWNEINMKDNYWLDSCRQGLKCEQGVLSFHVDYNLNVSICSNMRKKIPYESLKKSWPQLKSFQCAIRDNYKNL